MYTQQQFDSLSVDQRATLVPTTLAARSARKWKAAQIALAVGLSLLGIILLAPGITLAVAHDEPSPALIAVGAVFLVLAVLACTALGWYAQRVKRTGDQTPVYVPAGGIPKENQLAAMQAINNSNMATNFYGLNYNPANPY